MKDFVRFDARFAFSDDENINICEQLGLDPPDECFTQGIVYLRTEKIFSVSTAKNDDYCVICLENGDSWEVCMPPDVAVALIGR
jgi:hypothetical protein